ncbi:hypothetical protein Hanom_Chr16g01456351 [Helianthus anomalus]
MRLMNFGTKFPFKLGMMWDPTETHSYLDLPLHFSNIAYKILGQNFFKVGDDVTNRVSMVLQFMHRF